MGEDIIGKLFGLDVISRRILAEALVCAEIQQAERQMLGLLMPQMKSVDGDFDSKPKCDVVSHFPAVQCT